MAHWIIDDYGFGGTFYECSECGQTFWDICDDVCGAEECPNYKASINDEQTVYKKNGRIEE